MSITVFVKTKVETHDVEVFGTETVGDLYKKAGDEAGLMVWMFKLVWEETILNRFGGGEVQGSGLGDQDVVYMVVAPSPMVGLRELKECPAVSLELERLVKDEPDLVLEVDVGDLTDSVVCIERGDLPSRLRGLLVTDSTNRVWDIGDGFLCDSPLRSLHLKLELNTIGSGFLMGSSLTDITFGDQSFFTNFTSIGTSFLYDCRSLQTLDLGSSFTNVTSIGKGFLFHCRSLQTLDLGSSFTNVTSIGDMFLYDCRSLQTLNLGSSFTNVTSIGKSFLFHCRSLQTLDLGGCFTNVTSIGDMFLYDCRSLQILDLGSSFTNVTSIGKGFLSLCSDLQTLDLGSSFTNVTSIGDDFLRDCSNLQTLDLGSSFTNVTSIDDGFLYDCRRLCRCRHFGRNVTAKGEMLDENSIKKHLIRCPKRPAEEEEEEEEEENDKNTPRKQGPFTSSTVEVLRPLPGRET